MKKESRLNNSYLLLMLLYLGSYGYLSNLLKNSGEVDLN